MYLSHDDLHPFQILDESMVADGLDGYSQNYLNSQYMLENVRFVGKLLVTYNFHLQPGEKPRASHPSSCSRKGCGNLAAFCLEKIDF